MAWHTILVPFDFSAGAERALAIAHALAVRDHARLVLCHVIELSPHFGPETTLILPEGTQTPVGMHQYAHMRASEDLRARIDRLGAAVPVTCEIREGAPAAELLALVAELGADLVVMGTHGRSGWRRVVAGSVAERIVRVCPVPVLTTRDPAEAPRT